LKTNRDVGSVADVGVSHFRQDGQRHCVLTTAYVDSSTTFVAAVTRSVSACVMDVSCWRCSVGLVQTKVTKVGNVVYTCGIIDSGMEHCVTESSVVGLWNLSCASLDHFHVFRRLKLHLTSCCCLSSYGFVRNFQICFGNWFSKRT
jgi:hypothetical protein